MLLHRDGHITTFQAVLLTVSSNRFKIISQVAVVLEGKKET